jgi:hypothetical protein
VPPPRLSVAICCRHLDERASRWAWRLRSRWRARSAGASFRTVSSAASPCALGQPQRAPTQHPVQPHPHVSAPAPRPPALPPSRRGRVCTRGSSAWPALGAPTSRSHGSPRMRVLGDDRRAGARRRPQNRATAVVARPYATLTSGDSQQSKAPRRQSPWAGFQKKK